MNLKPLNIAVLLPCYNEAATIADVVKGFAQTLPNATIYVYDNNSTDNTSRVAALAGALVVRESRQGKGHVVRRMFADIEADLYVMADGDGTYDPTDAPKLIEKLLEDRCDMVVGTRAGVHDDAGRAGHALGNRLFNAIYRQMFGPDFTDIFSGYRVFTRRYVKSFPAVSGGFEIETEMSVHAGQLKLPIAEIELNYGRRPEGSHSKLSTFRDGFKILLMFVRLMQATQPFRLYGMISALLFGAAVIFAIPPVVEFMTTGMVNRVPTWIGAVGLMLLATVMAFSGLVLNSVAKGRAEQKRLNYLAQPPVRGEMRPRVGHQERRSKTKRKTVDAPSVSLEEQDT
ncbi:MAG: glycosyltransferase [Pseudomonadota bacterium]